MADHEPEEYASDWEYEYLDNETEVSITLFLRDSSLFHVQQCHI